MSSAIPRRPARRPRPSIRCRRPRSRSKRWKATRGITARSSDRKSTRLNSSHLGISYAVFTDIYTLSLHDALPIFVRDKIGSFKERNEMEAWLNKWISQYVLSNPASAGEETKAKYPLSAAEVTVEEVEGNPGYYSSKFYLRPHYQLEGLTVSLRLVSKLPSAKGGK